MTTLATPMLERFGAYVRCSTPLIEISTLDNAETIASIAERYSDRPMIEWDIARGMNGLNPAGKRTLMASMPEPDPISGEVNVKALTTNPVDALGIAQKFEKRTFVFFHNLQLYLQNEAVQQAFWNGRDSNKTTGRCWIGLGPAFDNPPTIAQDVVLLDEPAPSSAVLESLVEANRTAFNDSAKKENQIPAFAPEVMVRAADAVLGMSAFAADNAIAVNMTSKGLDIPGLWTAKISRIGQIKGLSVHRGQESIENYVGYDYAKDLMLSMVNGSLGIKGLWLWDEIDKDFSGNAGDNTGVSQELHGMILKLINDLDIPCVLFGGVWGTGKTELVKSVRNAAKGGEIAMVNASLAAMKSGVVGSSMTAFLTAWKTSMGIMNNMPLMVFTANSLKPLSPEFRSRMMVQLFFDQPSEEQVAALWKTYTRKFELRKQELPESKGWVGREVRKCCKLSSVLGIPLVKAARGIVPQTLASAGKLREIRREANNSLVDANDGGPYQYKDSTDLSGGQRAFDN